MRATEVTAGLTESNGSILSGLWRDLLHVTCGLTACTPGSAPGPTLGNEYGKTLPFTLLSELCCLSVMFVWLLCVHCKEQGADLHMAQLIPLPLTVSCFCKIQIGFTFLVPAHPGSPGKEPLNGCVCVVLCTMDSTVMHCNIHTNVSTVQFITFSHW